MAAGHTNFLEELKIIFHHDIDENNSTSNFEYVIVSKNENVSSREGKCKTFFIDGTEKEVDKKNLSEITPGSTMAAMLSNPKLVSMEDFKVESQKFFKERGVNVVFI